MRKKRILLEQKKSIYYVIVVFLENGLVEANSVAILVVVLHEENVTDV